MEKGLSLVELLIALTLASVLVGTLYQFHRVSLAIYGTMRDEWYCMQSLRQALTQINDDVVQSGLMLPKDLTVMVEGNHLFIASIPVTSEHPGICPSEKIAPPYYSIIVSSSAKSVVLDTVDIDGDKRADYWADLGMITDTGPCIISHNYSRGSTSIALNAARIPSSKDRAVPAIHYELKGDGLYRDNQLLAEAVTGFEPMLAGNDLSIQVRATYHGTVKTMLFSYSIR